jgi:uncharacterized protein YfbU (UPF0304 family)
MGVTNLSKDDLEVMLQLYDSLVDVLQKENEIGKMISEQENNHDKTEKQFSNLDKQFEELNNSDNMTLAGVMECRDIIVKAIKGKDEFSELIHQSGILYSEYHTVTDERLKLRKEIDELLKKGQVMENKKHNQGINVSSLNMIVHIINPSASEFVKKSISENSKISVSTYNVVNDIARTYSNYEEESEVVLNNYEKLIALYNQRNRTKEEDEAFLSKLPKFCKKDTAIINKEEPVLEESAKQTENIVEPKKIVTFANDNVPLNNEEVNQIILDTDRKAGLEEKIEPPKTDEVNEENKKINIDSLKLDEEKPNLDVVIESLTPEKNSDNLSGSDLEDIIYINVPANPTKIANSSKQKQEVILNVWKKYYVKKTILKQGEKKQNVTSDNIVPLDSLFSVQNDKLQETKDEPITNIQSFLSNAA